MAAPFYRITDPNRHGAKCSPESADGSRAHRRWQIQFEARTRYERHLKICHDENGVDGMEGEEQGPVTRGTVQRPRTPRVCGWGAAPNPARGTSPLRPPAPFPFLWMVRNGPQWSRVRRPRQLRAPLTTAGRSEDCAMTRERGPKKNVPPPTLDKPPVGRPISMRYG